MESCKIVSNEEVSKEKGYKLHSPNVFHPFVVALGVTESDHKKVSLLLQHLDKRCFICVFKVKTKLKFKFFDNPSTLLRDSFKRKYVLENRISGKGAGLLEIRRRHFRTRSLR